MHSSNIKLLSIIKFLFAIIRTPEDIASIMEFPLIILPNNFKKYFAEHNFLLFSIIF